MFGSFFFRWDILLICLITVLKLVATVFTSLPFQTFWPNWLNFFRVFEKNSVYEYNRKKASLEAIRTRTAGPLHRVKSYRGSAHLGREDTFQF